MRYGEQEPTISICETDYHRSEGQMALDLYALAGREAMPWQAGLINDIMALDDNDKYIHIRVGYSLPRRDGKGEVLLMRELIGLAKGEVILHTAHRTSTAHSAFERLKDVLEAMGLRDRIDYNSIKAEGKERIQLAGGGDIHFRTRTTTGGLGEGFDLLVIDEAQEYQHDQESTLDYTNTSSQNKQTIMCGTPPTLISSGTVFSEYRARLIEGKGQPFEAWFEWSVPQFSDVNDVDLWYDTNPSLGYRLKERDILSEVGETAAKKIDFNIQRLGLWFSYNQQSAISRAAWNRCEVKELPKFDGDMVAGIKYAVDGSTVTLAIAIRSGEQTFVEVVGRREQKAGNGWLLDFLRKASPMLTVVDGASGQSILERDIKLAKIKTKVMLPKVDELIHMNSEFESGIYSQRLMQMNQPSVAQMVSNCGHRAIGNKGGFGYKTIKDGLDVTLIEAMALAYSPAAEYKKKKQVVR